jgi:plasmid stability protein
MTNLTVTVPEEILKRARQRALQQGISVNALLRDYLSQFASGHSAPGKKLTIEQIWERGKRLGLASPKESARIVRKLRDARHGRPAPDGEGV